MIEAGVSDQAINIELRRHKDGIKVTVKVFPEVEAFFEKWSGGLQEQPGYGRLWRFGDGALWTLGAANINPSAMRPYSLAHGGAGFYLDNGYVNISFLRLVGVSMPEGRSIIVETVMGRGEIAQLAQRLSEACNLFYGEYLQPVNVRAVVSVFSLPNAA